MASTTDVDLSQSQGPLVNRILIAFTVLPTIAIAIRFWSRLITPGARKLWWDDWLAVLAWACCVGCNGLFFEGVKLGFGKHFKAYKSQSDFIYMNKLILAASTLFEAGITFAKLSVLVFYRRVFPKTPPLYKVLYGIALFLVMAFALTQIPINIFQCRPLNRAWNRTIPGHCVGDWSNFAVLVSGLVLDVVPDLLILILPMPVIVGLQLSKKRKVVTFVAFFFGYATFIVSVGRLASYMVNRRYTSNPDFSWYVVRPVNWSLIELAVSVVSICLIACITIVRRASNGGVSALFHSRELPKKGGTLTSQVTSSGLLKTGITSFGPASSPSASTATWSKEDEDHYPGRLVSDQRP